MSNWYTNILTVWARGTSPGPGLYTVSNLQMSGPELPTFFYQMIANDLQSGIAMQVPTRDITPSNLFLAGHVCSAPCRFCSGAYQFCSSAKLHSKVRLYGTFWSKLPNSVFSNCKFWSKCVSSAKICVNRVGRRANSALSSANYILLALPTLL